LHWNGRSWQRVPAPHFEIALFGVSATSATNAWAVGSNQYLHGHMIFHWNGTTWQHVPDPPSDTLSAVAATSSRSAWAVGSQLRCDHCNSTVVIFRWAGGSWQKVPIPALQSGFLTGVAATSPSSGWAVGMYTFIGGAIILRWNGASWSQVPPPRSGGPLNAIAAWPHSAWAVGSARRMNILHWNGTSWRALPGPEYLDAVLNGVAIASSRSVWAVGYTRGFCAKTVILHWDGVSWARPPRIHICTMP
jgi:hypothetical protein